MIAALLDRLFPGRAAARLNPTKRVRLHGIVFTIRKLNPLDYMAGAKCLHPVYDTYQKGPKASEGLDEKQVEVVKRHYRETFLQGVVSVKIGGRELEPTLKERPECGPDKLPVSHLMSDWALAEELYLAIVVFTYGKKKLRTGMRLLKKSSSSAT